MEFFFPNKKPAEGAAPSNNNFMTKASRVNAAAARASSENQLRRSANSTRQQMHSFLNKAFRESEHEDIRKAYNTFKNAYPHKNAINAISNTDLRNNFTRRLRSAVENNVVHIPEEQKKLARQWKTIQNKRLLIRSSSKLRHTRKK